MEERKILPYFIQDEFFAAEDIYNDTTDILHDMISNFIKPNSPACDDTTDSSFRDATKSFLLHLAHIVLPKFSSNFSNWENFRHTFESLVDSNDVLSNILKFHYLK